MFRHLGFLCWFAWLDLFQHCRARRVALTVAATIAGLVALILLT